MCRNVFPKGKCVVPSKIPKLLPTIVKLMGSKFPKVQEEAIFFITVITTTSNRAKSAEQNTQKTVDAGAVKKLVKCLSSRSADVQELALRCIENIAFKFPDEILATNGITTAVIKKSTKPVVCEEVLKALNTS
uniref:Uncharacterized protein n=1 Tax=Panagrolaimus superbus TaxID=310955 RepID=A0A914Z433_9BILA